MNVPVPATARIRALLRLSIGPGHSDPFRARRCTRQPGRWLGWLYKRATFVVALEIDILPHFLGHSMRACDLAFYALISKESIGPAVYLKPLALSVHVCTGTVIRADSMKIDCFALWNNVLKS